MFELHHTASIVTPALVVFHEATEKNLRKMIEMAGSATRLRPHCKTHKMPAMVRWWLELGVTRHKCATFAEAEMVARAGAQDVLLAYPIVGANIPRVVAFRKAFPDLRFSVLVDHPRPLKQLETKLASANTTVDALLDVETGLKRTGIAPGSQAVELYRAIHDAPHVTAAGLHWYDGHLHQRDINARRQAVLGEWQACCKLREKLEAERLPVPAIVAGGTGSFPIYAELDDPAIELSPGSCVFHDSGYGEMFPEMPFTPSARLLTRVISRPSGNRVTLDLGYKAVASDQPLETRVLFPDLPDAVIVVQNEEHLVLETEQADRFVPGDELWGIPRHICPTSALHKEAIVVRNGEVVDRWAVTARDRVLTW